MPDAVHLALPFRFERARDRTRAAQTVQDSVTEIADCVELCVRTPTGTRITLPDFGRPDLDFTANRVLALTSLQEAIDRAEPRARGIVEGDYDPYDPGVLRLRAMFELLNPETSAG